MVFPPDTTPDNNTSTITVNAISPHYLVPTLPQWALILLALLVGAATIGRRGTGRRF